MPGAPASLLRLREAVWPLHQSLETIAPLAAIADGHADKALYLSALQRFYGFLVPFEEQLQRFAASASHKTPVIALLKLAPWARSSLLRRDLQKLGMSASDIEALPRVQHLPPIDNDAQAIGHLYLLEGSRLGGKTLAARVKQSLGFDETNGCAYFSSEGHDVAPHWSAFKSLLAAALSPAFEAEVIKDAQRCFLAVGAWLGGDS